MRAGVDVRAGACADPGGGGEDDRGEQDDGGVQAEDGGDDRGDGEDAAEQRPGLSPAGAGHQVAGGPEQPLVGAELGQYEDGGEEPDDGQQLLDLSPGLGPGHRPQGHHEHGGGHGDGRLRQPPGAQHGEGEDAQEQGEGDELGGDGVQDGLSGWVEGRCARRTGAPPLRDDRGVSPRRRASPGSARARARRRPGRGWPS